jgi:hypothetical protein
VSRSEIFDASAILTEAAASHFGIAVSTADLQAAQTLRRRLYAERARLRHSGARQFDALSMLIKGTTGSPQREVWVLRRQSRPKPSEPYRSRALGEDELPELIRARGPRRPSAFFPQSKAPNTSGSRTGFQAKVRGSRHRQCARGYASLLAALKVARSRAPLVWYQSCAAIPLRRGP